MANFLDRFDRDDETSLDGNGGWVVYGEGGTTDIRLKQGVAVNGDTANEAVAFQRGTKPDSRVQRIKAAVVAGDNITQGDDCHVGIGIHGTGTSAATVGTGYMLRLVYVDVPGTRLLELCEYTSNGLPANVTVLKAYTATADVVQRESSDLGVLQIIELTATPVPGGLRLRGYLNEEDEGKPDIDWTVDQDWAPNKASDTDNNGDWFIYVGAAGADDQLGIAEVWTEDWGETSTDAVWQQDQLTRAEVRTVVERRYGGSNTNLPQAMLDEMLVNVVDDIIQTVGAAATFMHAQQEMVIDRDSNGYFTLPSYMENVTGIYYLAQHREIPWEIESRTRDGRLQGRMPRWRSPGSGTYRVEYEVDWERLQADTDRIPIPRKFSEVVYHGVMARVAGDRDSSPAREASYTRSYELGKLKMIKVGNRELRQHKRGFVVKRQRHTNLGQLRPYGTGYGAS